MNNMKVINKGRLALKNAIAEDDNLMHFYNTIANFELSEYDKSLLLYKGTSLR
jgi:hypothetical protein